MTKLEQSLLNLLLRLEVNLRTPGIDPRWKLEQAHREILQHSEVRFALRLPDQD